MEIGDRVDRLIAAAAQYDGEVSGHYDQVILEVAARADAAGSIGKTDIGALLAWKRLRADTPYMAALMAMPDEVVRRHTSRALEAARDEEQPVAVAARAARAALSPLPGFKHGDALAS